MSAVFLEEAQFNSTHFKEHANFGYTKFHQDTEFNGAVFDGFAHFHQSEFMQNGNFDSAHFSTTLLFNTAKAKQLHFTNVNFSEIEFRLAKIDSCQFWQSKFINEIDFSCTIFNKVDYRRCQFHSYCNFTNTSFSEVDFSYSLFLKSAHFIETKFIDIAYLNYVRFERPTEIIFQRMDLSKTSLVNTDISRINFGENIVAMMDLLSLIREG